jgi:PAS domain S-box-containing protein
MDMLSISNREAGLPDAFSLLMGSIGDYAIILTDLHGRILDWNTGATRLLGHEPMAVMGKSSSLLFEPEAGSDGAPDLQLQEALGNGKSGEERWILKQDGTRFWGASRAYPLSREGGAPVGFVRIIRDSSVQRENPDALSESTRKMDFVLENLKDHAIFMIDSQGVILNWNPGSERVFGYGDSEAVGQPFSTIFTPEDILAGIPDRELSIARAEGKAEDERWHQRKDGSRFWASGAVVPVQADGGRTHFIKIVRDATDRKRAEDADRMESIGRLAGGVAHDYNNMLTSIIGYCELLSASTPEDSHHQNWLGEMLASANRAATLTRDLLAFSRKQMITPVRLNLNGILAKMQGRLRMALGDRIRLIMDADPDLEDTLLDQGQIEQVLINLALNSREAMPKGGVVTIRTLSAKATAVAAGNATGAAAASATSAANALNAASATRGSEILPGPSGEHAEPEMKSYTTLIFKDDGKGMDAETSAHAFDPFFSTKPRSTGSVGLGLSTGYGIVQQSGGTIALTSVPGAGTEIEIHLPVFMAESPAPQAGLAIPMGKKPETGSKAAGPRKETVLLVEDEAAVRKLASEVLRKSGYQVLEAKDGEEGLAAFVAKADEIDIVVTDVVMPKLGGLAMAERILSRRPDAPIVFMSGYSDDPIPALNMPHSKCVFLQKPFSIAGLLEKISDSVLAKPDAAAKT